MKNGCVEKIEAFLDEHPAVRLIVIDVIQRVVSREGKQPMYHEDYNSITPLQNLARRRGIAMLGVHHTRKQSSDDPMETVSGSHGITGVPDCILVLHNKRKREAKLYITGRDIAEQKELAVKHNKNGSWTIVGDAERHFISNERQAILNLLREKGPMKPKSIAEALDGNDSTIRSHLSSMLSKELLEKDKSGNYSVANELSIDWSKVRHLQHKQ
jgi:DNA-binding transcriptional ArsR family regulator